MQQQGVGPLQVHGIPGTPVGDLFPPGNAVFGDGNRSSLRPIRAGELRSHSAVSYTPGRARKIAVHWKVDFGQFHANTPFPMPPSSNL